MAVGGGWLVRMDMETDERVASYRRIQYLYFYMSFSPSAADVQISRRH